MTQFGSGYRAATRLTTKAGDLLADVGDTCERVPESALRGWLIPQGLAVAIEPVDKPAPEKTAKKAKGDA